MKGAQAVALCLKEQGVDTVFGYPGGMILPLYDAFYENPDIREILVTHEQNAAHAADGYARASGKVGVCIATSGPGATNLVTGLATAFMDSVPVDLEEAAWVDGATVWQGIRQIVTPLMVPGLCMVGVYTFSGSWGNFFVPYILLGSASKFTASITLYQFFGAYGQIAYGQLAAYSVLYMAPSVILYTVTQKFMSKGFAMQGASKG